MKQMVSSLRGNDEGVSDWINDFAVTLDNLVVGNDEVSLDKINVSFIQVIHLSDIL